MKKTLLQQAEELRDQLPPATDQQYAEIARGAGLTSSWVALFAKGRVPNPGVITLDKLRTGLTSWKKGHKR